MRAALGQSEARLKSLVLPRSVIGGFSRAEVILRGPALRPPERANRRSASGRTERRELFNMAEGAPSAAPSPRGRADGEDAELPEEQMAETAREDQEQFECQELLECQVQLGAPPEEEDAGLVAEAEAVAAGWMLDFLCLSLCRAFRDGRSGDFHRTRDSAEGECRAHPSRGLVCSAVPRQGGRLGCYGAAAGGPWFGYKRWLESRIRLLTVSQVLFFSSVK